MQHAMKAGLMLAATSPGADMMFDAGACDAVCAVLSKHLKSERVLAETALLAGVSSSKTARVPRCGSVSLASPPWPARPSAGTATTCSWTQAEAVLDGLAM